MSELLSLFANNLLPVFLAAGTGYLLGNRLPINTQTLSRVVFYIFSPALVFTLLTQNQLNSTDLLRMASFAIAHMAIVGAITYVLGRALGFDRRLFVAVLLTSMFANAGNFGLSLNLFAFGNQGLAYASLYFITSGSMAYSVGVLIASLGKSSARDALIGMTKIPAIYAVVLALIVVGMDWVLPLPLERTVTVLGDAAIPTMLVLLGMLLQRAEWTGQIKGLGFASVMRLLVSPLIAIGLSALFGLQGVARQAGIMETAMPSAVMTTVLATEFDVEPGFVTLVVFTTTLASPLTITPLLAFLGG